MEQPIDVFPLHPEETLGETFEVFSERALKQPPLYDHSVLFCLDLLSNSKCNGGHRQHGEIDARERQLDQSPGDGEAEHQLVLDLDLI